MGFHSGFDDIKYLCNGVDVSYGGPSEFDDFHIDRIRNYTGIKRRNAWGGMVLVDRDYPVVHMVVISVPKMVIPSPLPVKAPEWVNEEKVELTMFLT